MKTFAAAAVMAILTGCASAPETPAPAATSATHYWESATKASENRYRVDNLACQSTTQADQGSTVFEPGSESFDSYRDCMISRGYVLRHY